MTNWLIANRLHDASWLQAYSNVAALFTSIITLLILFRYAYDTYRLAQITTPIPFLALIALPYQFENGPYEGRITSRWAIQNQGTGAAVNIKLQCSYEKPNIIYGMGGSTQTGTISTDLSKLPNPIAVGAANSLRISADMPVTKGTIEYESLQGRMFRTRIETVNGEHRVTFERLKHHSSFTKYLRQLLNLGNR